MSQISTEIGKQIRTFRKKRKMTLEALAAVICKSKSTVSKYENGEIPVDIETGKLKVGTDLQTSLSSALNSYRMRVFGEGKYTVGVQTLDQSYAGSKFATAGFSATGIRQVAASDHFRVVTVDSGVVIRGVDNHKVVVYAMDGRTVNTGFSNTVIPLSEKGVYVVSVSGEDAPLKCMY